MDAGAADWSALLVSIIGFAILLGGIYRYTRSDKPLK
jgi:hypothetical protein